MKIKTFVPGTVPTKEMHQLLLGTVAPRPIAFASTISRDGIPNLSPFSFFNIFSSNPPIGIFSPSRRVRNNTTKDTLANVYEVPEVVINSVSYSMVNQSNLASAEYPKGTDEFIKAGFTHLPSEKVRPFRVAESPVQMECLVEEIKPISSSGGGGNLIICRIVMMHIREEILKDDGLIDPQKIDLVGRMSEQNYCRASGEAVVEIEKPLFVAALGIDGLPQHIRESKILSGNDLARLGNVEKLPDEIELVEFKKNKMQALIATVSSKEDVHRLAKTLLSENRKEEALQLLLSAG